MTTDQSQFRAALLDAMRAVPDGLLNDGDGPAGKRFDVYRNNVMVSLTDALGVGFPTVKKLIGGQNFKSLAGLYVRAHPPTSPLMMHYGEHLPDFLEQLEQLAHIGYLADCARLDLAMRRSYHAADATPLHPSALAIETNVLAQKRFALAPSTIILRSAWPLFDIWRFNNEPDAPKPRAVAQDVLITRLEFDPQPHLLPKGGADWFQALSEGEPFAAAHDAVAARTPDFDLTAVLTFALTSGALTKGPSSI